MPAWRRNTHLVHAGKPAFAEGTAPVNAPVTRTSTVRFETTQRMAELHHRRDAGEAVSAYGRHGTQTHRALESALCGLEGGVRAYLAPSGLSAISLTLLALTRSGDHVLVTDNVYQPVKRIDRALLARFGVEVEYARPDAAEIVRRLRPGTRVIYSESPGSVLYEMADISALAEIARSRSIALAVDNTWASGLLFNPLRHGASVSIIANTKYIVGHSDVMQGVAILGDAALAPAFDAAYDGLGLCVGPDDAYLALRGLRTLGVRLRQHAANAMAVAQGLQSMPEVRRVYSPALPGDPGHALWRRDFSGANGLISVAFEGYTMARINAVADALTLFSIGASWGGYESLALPVPAEKLGAGAEQAGAGVLRLHIGLEDPQDLLDDLTRAMALAASHTQA